MLGFSFRDCRDRRGSVRVKSSLIRSVAGFTLVELMIVVAIMAVLAAIAIPTINHQRIKHKAQQGKYLTPSEKRTLREIENKAADLSTGIRIEINNQDNVATTGVPTNIPNNAVDIVNYNNGWYKYSVDGTTFLTDGTTTKLSQ